MPVTKTAKRALRGAKRKEKVNSRVLTTLEIAMRRALKDKKEATILKAMSLTDRAAKKHTIHKNKAARIKSKLTSLLPKKTATKPTSKKTVKSLKK